MNKTRIFAVGAACIALAAQARAHDAHSYAHRLKALLALLPS